MGHQSITRHPQRFTHPGTIQRIQAMCLILMGRKATHCVTFIQIIQIVPHTFPPVQNLNHAKAIRKSRRQNCPYFLSGWGDILSLSLSLSLICQSRRRQPIRNNGEIMCGKQSRYSALCVLLLTSISFILKYQPATIFILSRNLTVV